MLQQILQNKISGILGATVAFGKLSVSPFRGVVDGELLTAGMDDAMPPFLTVERIKLEVNMSQLLHKRIEIETAVFEKPVLTIHRRADGKCNLPLEHLRRGGSSSAEPIDAPAEKETDSKPWGTVIKRLLLADGSIRYTDDSPGFDGYAVLAEPLNVEITTREHGRSLLSVTVDSLCRTDREADLGMLRVNAELTGLDQFPSLSAVTGHLTADLDQQLRLQIGRDEDQLHAEFSATLAAESVLDVLPGRFAGLVPLLLAQAHADLHLAATWNPDQGLRLRTTDPPP